ncbi:hypothetical protein JVU11DRAFT_8626 [Chiua virens]|nr:hypothetical protein JVU11DRAFT_8626 [Chiua virens]
MPRDIPKDVTRAALVKILIRSIPARPRELLESCAHLTTLLDHATRTKLLTILKLHYWLLHLKFIWASKKGRMRALVAWWESLSPVGASPFESSTVYGRWASIDDIDMFGFHLSNSSYSKAPRTKAAVKWFPTWGHSGGHLALGATHYHFLREIAPLVRYEVRLTIGSWDHKWLYLVARYVTLPRQRRATQFSPLSSQTSSTPNDSPTPALENGSASVEQAVAAIIHADNNGNGCARPAPFVELDGATLHCVAVAQVCFKWGRLTVPPAIVLASEGFTRPCGDDVFDGTSAGMHAYSHANPPPNWIKSQSLRVPLTEAWITSALSFEGNGVTYPRVNDGGRMRLGGRLK